MGRNDPSAPKGGVTNWITEINSMNSENISDVSNYPAEVSSNTSSNNATCPTCPVMATAMSTFANADGGLLRSIVRKHVDQVVDHDIDVFKDNATYKVENKVNHRPAAQQWTVCTP